MPSIFAKLAAVAMVAATATACSDSQATDASDAGQPKLEPNDVSILLTLPRTPDERSSYLYLLPSSSIFPAGLESELPSLFSTAPGTPEELYQSMQVTAFRFVPCSAATAPDPVHPCKPQVRLGVQFVSPAAAGDYMMDEVALHLFYDLAPEEPALIARELLELKNASPVKTAGKALFVHPALADGGMLGPWGERFRAMVRRFAKKEKLVRVTSVGFVFDSWPFRDSKIDNGHVVEQSALPHLAEPGTSQVWDIFGDADRVGNITPASTAESGPDFFTLRSRYLDAGGAPKDTPEVREAADSLERTLNPLKHTADSVDCVSCHVSRFVKERAKTSGVSFASPDTYQPPAWANVDRLQDSRIERAAANVVQFGYFLRQSSNEGLPEGKPLPSVSERIIHDSIEAAKLASKLLDD
jgi:hypothetical protein